VHEASLKYDVSNNIPLGRQDILKRSREPLRLSSLTSENVIFHALFEIQGYHFLLRRLENPLLEV